MVPRRIKTYQRQDSMPLTSFGGTPTASQEPVQTDPASAQRSASKEAEWNTRQLEEERLAVQERHRRQADAAQKERAAERERLEKLAELARLEEERQHQAEDAAPPTRDRSRRSAGATEGERKSGGVGGSADGVQKLGAENQYLRRNVDHLRKVKHVLEGHIRGLETRNQWLEQQMEQHKALISQLHSQKEFQGTGGSDMELVNLQEQLEAVMMIKKALNTENLELQRRLEKAEARKEELQQGTCVVCLDNLANLVCLPCKHLAMCMDCGLLDNLANCPICRVPVEDKMQIFCP